MAAGSIARPAALLGPRVSNSTWASSVSMRRWASRMRAMVADDGRSAPQQMSVPTDRKTIACDLEGPIGDNLHQNPAICQGIGELSSSRLSYQGRCPHFFP